MRTREDDFIACIQLDVDLGDEDAFLRVEVIGDVLEGEDLFVEHDALAGVDATESGGCERAAADEHGALRSVFDEDEFVVAEGEDAFVGLKALSQMSAWESWPKVRTSSGSSPDWARVLSAFAALELMNDFDPARPCRGRP